MPRSHWRIQSSALDMSSKSATTPSSSSSSSLNRVVVLGESQANKGFPSNKLQTAKFETNWQLLFYGLISCIFSSVASVYFFTVGLLQMFTPWRYIIHLLSAPPPFDLSLTLCVCISNSPTGKFATMGPYGSNKLFEMATLFWFNKKDRNTDKKVNSRKVKVITRNGMYTKERKGENSKATNDSPGTLQRYTDITCRINRFEGWWFNLCGGSQSWRCGRGATRSTRRSTPCLLWHSKCLPGHELPDWRKGFCAKKGNSHILPAPTLFLLLFVWQNEFVLRWGTDVVAMLTNDHYRYQTA